MDPRRRLPRALTALLLAWLLPACQTTPSDPTATPAAPETPLERASRALESGELEVARRALEEQLDDDSDDVQARYLLARTLAGLNELRAAKREATTVVGARPRNGLYWSLLAALHEQLGEHHQALRCYQELQRLVPDSLEPLQGIARCQLFLGQPAEALVALRTAGSRPARDAWIEYLSYQALRRMGSGEEAEGAARGFLELAEKDPLHVERAAEVRRWLAEQSESLPAAVRQLVVDYVRTACRLRLPDGSDGPEEDLLKEAPPRLFAYDDRPLFLTYFPRDGAPLRGRGRGKSLAAALKGAVESLQQQEGYNALAVREAALRVDLGKALEPATLAEARGGLTLEPPLQRGAEGLALRTDGRESYCLPGDPLTRDLTDLRDMLRFACAQAGLAPDAWQAGSRALFRFRCESFVSTVPGAAPITLVESEPTPLPEAYPEPVERALLDGARWATGLLRPDGTCAAGYAAIGNGWDPEEAPPEDEARLALALATASRRAPSEERPVLSAAAQHLLRRLIARREREVPGPTADAWTLAALDVLASADQLSGLPAGVALRDELAAAAPGGPAGEWARARRGTPPPLTAPPPPPAEPLQVLARLARLEAGQDVASAPLLEWGGALLTRPAPAETGEAARELEALCGAARLAARLADPVAADLREGARARAALLLAAQLGLRHAWFLTAGERAVGGFRLRQDVARVQTGSHADCLLALASFAELLAGR